MIRKPARLSNRVIQGIATRIANVRLPSSAGGIFSKLRKRQMERQGNYLGMASDPIAMSARYYGTQVPELPTTVKLKNRQQTFQTREQLALKGMGLPALGSLQAPPRPGIASAPNAAVAYEMVDDEGWPVTLSQILGSGLLTADQLRSASIQNIQSMLTFEGGTETDRMESAYLMQRMVLEGFIRGVDMLSSLKSGGTLSGSGLTMGFTEFGGNTIGMSYSTRNIRFAPSYWKTLDDSQKLILFYHEVGHELLREGHYGNGLMNPQPVYASGDIIGPSYDAYMDELFSNAPSSTMFTPTSTPTPQFDPSWYPSATGVTPTTGTPTGTNTLMNTTINMAPPMVTPWGGQSLGGSIAGSKAKDSSSPEDQDKTPVAGQLEDMASVYSFAAGLGDVASRQASGLQGAAGALMRFRSG